MTPRYNQADKVSKNGLVTGIYKNMSSPCPVLSRPVCPVPTCPNLSCPNLSCPVLSCPVLSFTYLDVSSTKKCNIFSALRFPQEWVYLSWRMESVVPPVAWKQSKDRENRKICKKNHLSYYFLSQNLFRCLKHFKEWLNEQDLLPTFLLEIVSTSPANISILCILFCNRNHKVCKDRFPFLSSPSSWHTKLL